MKNMTLTQIAAACSGQLIGCNIDIHKEAAGVVLDSRKVEKGYVFIATVGEQVDGHNYISAAFHQGALAVICEKEPIEPEGPYILVKDSFIALKDIARWYRQQLSIKVVGITGSVGKTSTKELISSVLAQKYKVLKTEGNYNNEVGMPLTILKIQDSHEIAVLEMGISDFGEMHRLSEIAMPDICVITNIGQCHLENLGSREGILKAKTEIFDFMKEDGFVCINGDDDMLATLKEIKGKAPITFGISSINNVFAENVITYGLFGSSCDIRITPSNEVLKAKQPFGKVIPINIPLPGEHMVLNALTAASVGTLLDMTSEEIATGLKTVQSVDGRSNIIRREKYTVIDDCYNANPVSMKTAVDLLNMADTRKVAILGDMFELGTTEMLLHEDVGRYAANLNLQVLICVGKLSLSMFEGASKVLKEIASPTEANSSTSMQLYYYETREELLKALPDIIRQNDTILVKASHGMHFEEVVKALD